MTTSTPSRVDPDTLPAADIGRWRVPAPPTPNTNWYMGPDDRYRLLGQWQPGALFEPELTFTEPHLPAKGAPTPAKERSILSSSAGQSVGTLLSRVTGLGRVVAMGIVLGQTLFTDQFNNANTSPNMIYELLLGGVLSATLVPIFTKAVDAEDEDGPSAILSVSIVVLGGLTLLSVIGAPVIHYAFTFLLKPAERAADAKVVVPLMRLLLPQIFAYGLMTVCTAALHARNRFAAAAFAPILSNLVFIATFLIAGSVWGDDIIAGDRPDALLYVLGIGTTFGVAIMTFTTMAALQDIPVTFRWNLNWRSPAVRSVAKLSGWTLGYAATNQVALVIITALARREPTTLSAYQTAFIFFQLPHGLFAVSIMNSIVPSMSRAFVADRIDDVKARFREGLSLLMSVVVPAAALLGVLAIPLVQAALGYGLFDGPAQRLTGHTVAAFAVGLPGFSVYLYTLRLFYAQSDTKTPFILNVFENGLNIVFAIGVISMDRETPAAELAYAFSAAYTIAAIAALIVASRRMPGVFSRQVRVDIVKVTVLAVAITVIVAPLRWFLDLQDYPGIMILAVCGVLALVVLAAGVAVLKIHGFESALALATGAFGKVRRRGRGTDPGPGPGPGASTPGPPKQPSGTPGTAAPLVAKTGRRRGAKNATASTVPTKGATPATEKNRGKVAPKKPTGTTAPGKKTAQPPAGQATPKKRTAVSKPSPKALPETARKKPTTAPPRRTDAPPRGPGQAGVTGPEDAPRVVRRRRRDPE